MKFISKSNLDFYLRPITASPCQSHCAPTGHLAECDDCCRIKRQYGLLISFRDSITFEGRVIYLKPVIIGIELFKNGGNCVPAQRVCFSWDAWRVTFGVFFYPRMTRMFTNLFIYIYLFVVITCPPFPVCVRRLPDRQALWQAGCN